jgi:hypothetical protein
VRLVIALIVWLVAVAAAVEVSSVVADSIHNKSASGGSSSASGGGGSGGGRADPSSVKATDPDSLFASPNFAKALAAARSRLGAGAEVTDLALYPGYLDLTVIKGSGEDDFYIDTYGRSMQTSLGASSGEAAFPLSLVKVGTPAALAKRIATEANVAQSQLNYMVADVDPVSNHFQWLIYPVQGTAVEYFQSSGGSGPLFELRTNSSSGPQPVAR